MEPIESLPLLGTKRPRNTAVCEVSPRVKSLCFSRASNRWSSLLTKTKSRIGFKCGMRKRLGESNWAAFVKYAEEEYKTDFFRAFTPVSGTVCCSGKLDGSPCPKELSVNMKPTSWDDGVCGPLVAHLLFGTEDHVVAQCSDRPVWRKQLFFRCGDVKGVEGQSAADFCHAPHKSTLKVDDIAWSS